MSSGTSVQSPTSALSPSVTTLRRLHEQHIVESSKVKVKTEVVITKDKVKALTNKFLKFWQETRDAYPHAQIPIPQVKKGTNRIRDGYVKDINEVNNNSDDDRTKKIKRDGLKTMYTASLVEIGYPQDAAKVFLQLAEECLIVEIKDTDENKTAQFGRPDNASQYLVFGGAIANASAAESLGGSPRTLASQPGTLVAISETTTGRATSANTGSPELLSTSFMTPGVATPIHHARETDSSMQTKHGSPKNHSPVPTPKHSGQSSPHPSEADTIAGEETPDSDTDTIADESDGRTSRKKAAKKDTASQASANEMGSQTTGTVATTDDKKTSKKSANGESSQTDDVDAITGGLKQLTLSSSSSSQTHPLRQTTTRKVIRLIKEDKRIFYTMAAGLTFITAIMAFAPRHCSELGGRHCTS